MIIKHAWLLELNITRAEKQICEAEENSLAYFSAST